MRVSFLNGPVAGALGDVAYELPRVTVHGATYELITDPDTGESLHAYAVPHERTQ